MASPNQTASILPWPVKFMQRDLESEFLPAALEVIETPANPLGRAITLGIVAFFCAALAWSWFGYVDIIATAQGRLLPSGRVKVVQPLEAGIVREIRVQDGDIVHAGDILVTLDDTVTSAERDRVAHDLMTAKLDIARRMALRGESDPGKAVEAFIAPDNAPAHEAEMARSFTWTQATEQAAKIAGLERQIDQKRAESEGVHASINKLQGTLPLLQEKGALRTKLLAMEFGNRFAWLDAEQALREAQNDLLVLGKRAVETEAAMGALERQRDQARAEYSHKI